jgi:phage shock protein C
MFCTRCGSECRQDDRFCCRCGTRTGVGDEFSCTKPLMLDKCNKKIAGVCAGFARYLEVDVVLVRVIWLAVALTAGIGVIAYLAAWIIMPSDHGCEQQPVYTVRPQTS